MLNSTPCAHLEKPSSLNRSLRRLACANMISPCASDLSANVKISVRFAELINFLFFCFFVSTNPDAARRGATGRAAALGVALYLRDAVWTAVFVGVG